MEKTQNYPTPFSGVGFSSTEKPMENIVINKSFFHEVKICKLK